MATLPDLVVKLSADIDGFEKSIGKAARETEQFRDRMTTAFKSVASVLAAGEIVRFAEDVGSALVEATLAAEKSQFALQSALRATQSSTGLTLDQLNKLADKVSDGTAFKPRDLQAAEAALLRFREVQSGVFEDALKLIPDVATALGTDLPSAAQTLGRALTDPEKVVKSLRASGLELRQSNIDLARSFIEAGDNASAQRLLLEELSKSIGGAAEGQHRGLTGATIEAGKAWDALKETLGQKLLVDTGFADNLTNVLRELRGELEKTSHGFLNLLSLPNPFAPKFVQDAVRSIRPDETVSQDGSGPSVDEEKAQASKAKAADLLASNAAYDRFKATLKRNADDASRILSGQLSSQQELFAEFEYGLQNLQSRQLISDADFFTKERRAIEENTAKTVAALGKQRGAQLNIAGAKTTDGKGFAFDLPDRQKALSAARDIADKITEAQTKGAFAIVKAYDQESLSVKNYVDELELLRAKVLEISGDKAGAATITFDIANADKYRKFQSERDSSRAKGDTFGQILAQSGTRDLNFVSKRETDLARINALLEKSGIIRDDLANKERLIADLEHNGQITALGAIAQTDAARQGTVVLLQTIADQQRAIADGAGAGNERLIQEAKNSQAALDGIAASAGELSAKFRDVYVGDFANFFDKLIQGTATVKDAFRSLAQDIIQSLSRIAAQRLAESLFSGVLGQGIVGATLAGFGLASGGPVRSGATYLVGEKGPELFRPSASGSIVPNNQLGRSGDKNISISVNVSGAEAGGPGASPNQLGRAIGTAVRQVLMEEMRPGGVLA